MRESVCVREDGYRHIERERERVKERDSCERGRERERERYATEGEWGERVRG
jgi:hypothetical protein